MQEIVGANLREFSKPGSMGVVTDTRFIRCLWPTLDAPTALFADGSSGLSVMGSSRNVVFPKDTVFENYFPDALYPAEQAVFALGRLRKLVNLNEVETQAWLKAYNDAVASFPKTHAVNASQVDCFFLVEKIAENAAMVKPNFIRYVAEISKEETMELIDGKITEQALRTAKEFKRADTGEALTRTVSEARG